PHLSSGIDIGHPASCIAKQCNPCRVAARRSAFSWDIPPVNPIEALQLRETSSIFRRQGSRLDPITSSPSLHPSPAIGHPLPTSYFLSSDSFLTFRYTTPNGGSETAMDWSLPWNGSSVDAIGWGFLTSLPPKVLLSLLKISSHSPEAGTPKR